MKPIKVGHNNKIGCLKMTIITIGKYYQYTYLSYGINPISMSKLKIHGYTLFNKKTIILFIIISIFS